MKLWTLLILTSGLAACTHAQPAPDAPAAPTTKPAAAEAAKPPPAPAAKLAPAQPAASAPSAESIYFDFDRADLKPAAEEMLARLGPALAKRPGLTVRIEGNCDERGSEEYNLALGQRRANAAKNYLVRMGAPTDHVTTVSYGEDKPRAAGHDEESWRQNRRDDLVLGGASRPGLPVSVNQ